MITILKPRFMVKVPKERNEGAKLEVRGITFAEMIRSEVRVER